LWTKQINQRKVPWNSIALQATVSMGIAAIPGHAQTGEELIAKADEALYYAKHCGRNQAVMYGIWPSGQPVAHPEKSISSG